MEGVALVSGRCSKRKEGFPVERTFFPVVREGLVDLMETESVMPGRNRCVGG
jgi:hypothetical protein